MLPSMNFGIKIFIRIDIFKYIIYILFVSVALKL